MTFVEKLRASWRRADSLLCIGLDTDPARIPTHLRADPGGILAFNRAVVDATADLVCAYKPQIAYYAAARAEDQLAETIAYIQERHPQLPVILDAKRGDIGATAEQYTEEAFERYGADAVTVNPYMGGDTLEPFLRREDKGVIVLCRTSNPGSGDLQELVCGGEKLYQIIARKAAQEWNAAGNVALVVGATWPEELAEVREIVGNMPLLVPGVGAQGGDLAAVIRTGATVSGTGLIINSSRGIIYAGSGEDFSEKVRGAAQHLVAEMRRIVETG